MSETPANFDNLKRTGLIAWMAGNPIAANLLMVIFICGGIWSAFTIQKEVFPRFEMDIVQVSVGYPGASPEEVEQGILQPVEEAIKGIQGIEEIVSTAREGQGEVSIELVAGTDRMRAFQDIDQSINRIRTFPDDAEQPEVMLQARERGVLEVVIYGDTDIWSLRKLAEGLRDRFLADRRITQVTIDHVPDYVTHVEIPQHRLRKYGLTLGGVASIIEQSSRDIPAGAVESRSGEIVLRMKERKQWAEEFGNIVVIPSETSSPVLLKDIADIEDGFDETGFHAHFNRQPSVELGIFRVGKQSPIDIAEAVGEVLADFETTLPPGLHLRIEKNRAEHYADRLNLLKENGIIAIVIVLVILAAFLEFRLAFWVMMGMIVSFLGGLMILPIFGVSINMISMFAFLVALGIVVDDAIIVGENIFEYRQQGMGFLESAVQGAKDIFSPVTFSVLTNIVTFVPLMFVPGMMGKFFWPIPVVVITVFAISLFEAVFILPAHLAHTLGRKGIFDGGMIHRAQQAFARGFNRFVDRQYRAFLDLALKYRYITMTIATALLIIVGGYGASDHMGMIMMPEVAADEIEAGVYLPVGTTLDQAAKIAHDITESTHRMFEKYNLKVAAEGIKTNVRRQTFIDVEIVMRPADEHDMTAKDIIELWRKEIGDIEGVDQITFQAESGPGGHRDDIMVDLSHTDIDVLQKASADFVELAKEFENARDVNDNYDKGKVQFDFKLLPEARNLGLTSEDVGNQLRHAFYGAVAKRQLRGTNEIEVRVKLPKEERKELASLEDFTILTSNGTEVPLFEVATVNVGEAFNSISRRNGRRVVTVGLDVEPRSAMTRVRASIDDEILPKLRENYPGLTWTYQGMHAEMGESTHALWGGFALAMFVVYALLAIAFGSYVQPLIVMVAIPFGIVGAVIGHILLGFDLSLMSLMGVVALSGVVVNDSLIMVHYANGKRKDHSAFEAIHEAGIRRFRPIVLTTLTTFGGLVPMILETSRQATFLIPMAISLGFGIVFTTAIILVIVPCLYMALDDVLKRFNGENAGPNDAEVHEGA